METDKKTSDKRLKNLKPGLTGNATPFTKENQPNPKLKIDGWEARRAKKLLSKTIFEGMEDPKTLQEYFEDLRALAKEGNAKAIDTINNALEDQVQKVETTIVKFGKERSDEDYI